MHSDLYLKHDLYALDDTLIMDLVYRFKATGYGVFWAIVEKLTIEPSHRIPIQVLAMQVAMKLMQTDLENIVSIVEYMVDIGLLEQEEEMVFSARVIRQCKESEDYRERQRKNIQARWDKYKKDKESTPREDHSAEIAELYHTICAELPKVRTLTPQRKAHCRTLLAEFGIETIKEGLQKVNESSFLRKGNKSWNGANFDWLINKQNFTKVLEGQYTDKKATESVCNDPSAYKKDQEGGFSL